MAGNKEFSLLTKLVLNATGFNHGIEQAKQKTKDLSKATEAASASIKGSVAPLADSFTGLFSSLKNVNAALTSGFWVFKAIKPAASAASAAIVDGFSGSAKAVQNFTKYLSGNNIGSIFKDVSKAATSMVSGVGSSFKSMISGTSGAFSNLGTKLAGVATMGAGSFKAMIPVFKSVSTALISTGIGAIVVALGVAFAALTSYLTGTSSGANKLKEAFGYVSGAVTAIMGRIKHLGAALVDIFTGNWSKLKEDLTAAFASGFFDEVAAGAKEGNRLAKETNAIKAAGRDLKIKTMKLEEEIALLNLKTRDMDEESRESAAKKLVYIRQEKKLIEESEAAKLAFAQRELKLIQDQNALKGKSNLTGEDKDKIIEAEQKISDIKVAGLDRIAGMQRLVGKLQNMVAKENEANIKKEENELLTLAKLKQEGAALSLENLLLIAKNEREQNAAEVEAWRVKEIEKVNAVKATTAEQVALQKKAIDDINALAVKKTSQKDAITEQSILNALKAEQLTISEQTARTEASNERERYAAEVAGWKAKEIEKINAIKATSAEAIAIQSEMVAKVNELAAKKIEKKNSALDLKDIETELSAVKNFNDQEIALVKQKYDANLISKNEYDAKMQVLNQKSHDTELQQLKNQFDQGVISADNYYKTLALLNEKYKTDMTVQNKSIMDGLKANFTSAEGKARLFGDAVSGISDSFIELATTGKTSFKGMIQSMLSGIRQIINGLLAQALAGQLSANSKFGLPGLAMAAVGMVAVEALFASLPAFATGGIVPGTSYTGDKVPVMVNSGEMILNVQQQRQLFSQINAQKTAIATPEMLKASQFKAANLAQVNTLPKFASGGIVPGANFYGDKVPIAANSGEMLLNASQQSKLFKQLNNPPAPSGEVVFRLQGSELLGVLNNHNRKMNNIR